MEAVLFTPELVDIIFAHTSRKANAVTALVCKQWLELSRDHIWFEVNNPKELFALLAPLGPNEETGEPVRIRVLVMLTVLTLSNRSSCAYQMKEIGTVSVRTLPAFDV